MLLVVPWAVISGEQGRIARDAVCAQPQQLCIEFGPISFEQAQALELAQQGTLDSLMPVNAMALPVVLM